MKRYEVFSPSCYSRFSCKGGDCRNTCCGGWSITMSKEEYQKTRKRLGCDFGTPQDYFIKRDKDISARKYQIALNEENKCPFLSGEGLCGLQLRFGPEVLSETCMRFPRVYHKYLHKVEGGLSLGCERVLELLLEERDGLRFSSYSKTLEDSQRFVTKVDEKKRVKYPALAYYYDIQSLCINMLQAKDATIEERLILLGVAIRYIDGLAKEGKAKAIPGYINDFLNQVEQIDASSQVARMRGGNLGVLYSNFVLMTRFINDKRTVLVAKRLEADLETAYELNENGKVKYTLQCSEEAYRKGQENFRRFREGREHFFENMMVAWMFYLNIPFSQPEEGVWSDYVHFVWGYSMMKFVLTMTLDEDSTDEDMIDTCTALFRKMGHNMEQRKQVLKQFEENESDSLAHMAVLLKS